MIFDLHRRSAHWLKLKKDYLESVGDTFDVVPIGAWFGKCVASPVALCCAVPIMGLVVEDLKVLTES